MYIRERYYFVDDKGIEHELRCTVDRAVDRLGEFDEFFIEDEIRRIKDREIKAELEAKGFLKPWWKFW